MGSYSNYIFLKSTTKVVIKLDYFYFVDFYSIKLQFFRPTNFFCKFLLFNFVLVEQSLTENRINSSNSSTKRHQLQFIVFLSGMSKLLWNSNGYYYI